MSRTLIRILLDILIAVFILQGWWLPALILATIGAWNFPYFIEFILTGIVYDSLYNFIPGMGVGSYAGTIVSVVVFLIVILLKKYIRK